MKFTNNICLKVRDESFESSIDVLDFVLCMNEMIKEKKENPDDDDTARLFNVTVI